MFTLTDKVLLDRAARMINEQAKALRLKWEMIGWAHTKDGRAAKLEYDRLLRDERDLRALGKRLCLHFDVKAAPRAAKPVPQDTAEVGDPLNALSPEARADYLSDISPGSERDFSGLKFDTNPGYEASQVPDAQAEGENVPRGASEGNPLLRTDPGSVTVEVLPPPVGDEVHDG